MNLANRLLMGALHPAAGGITYGGIISTPVAATSGTTATITLAVAVPAGATLVLDSNVSGGANINATSVADSRGNTWAVSTTTPSINAPRLAVCVARVATALQVGDTITVTYSGTITGSANVALHRYDGVASSSFVNAAAASDGAGTTATTGSTSATATVAGTTAHSLFGRTGTPGTVTRPAGYSDTGISSTIMSSAYGTIAGSGSVTATWSWTTARAWGVALVLLKPA